MALKGNLHDFSITQLLNLIHLARKTGTLAIDGKHSAARASFREGKLVFAQTDTLDSRLIGMLVKVGKITADQSKKIPANKTDRDLASMLGRAADQSRRHYHGRDAPPQGIGKAARRDSQSRGDAAFHRSTGCQAAQRQ